MIQARRPPELIEADLVPYSIDEDPKTASQGRACAFSILYLLSGSPINAPTRTIQLIRVICPADRPTSVLSEALTRMAHVRICFIIFRHLDCPFKPSTTCLIQTTQHFSIVIITQQQRSNNLNDNYNRKTTTNEYLGLSSEIRCSFRKAEIREL